MRNAMIISDKDNVAVAVEKIAKGTTAVYEKKGVMKEVLVIDDIPMYHKFAIEDIAKDENVIKYGEYIGVAGVDIKKGMHVHVHNVLSIREKVTD